MALSNRERLEDKIRHLCTMAKRYSIHDPRYLDLHRQIDESLEAWQLEVLVENGLVTEPTSPTD